MKKPIVVIAIIVLLGIVGVLLFSGKSNVPSNVIQATQPPGSSVAPVVSSTGTAKTIKVRAFQFGFDPSTITVNQGDVVTIELTSSDVAHGISIPGVGFDLKVDAGQTSSGTFTASQKGTFPFRCNTVCGSGHRDMVGTLIVN
ncbi:Nitrous-oxide reductase [uncultured archaeon]|nr:Nitrous-oxide reductase [uncultured archaeon]